MITIEEAKAYLRDDWMHTYKVEELIKTANTIVFNESRLSEKDWEEIEKCTLVNKSLHSKKEIIRVALFYTIGYLYEHNNPEDIHDLVLTLRNLLFSIREGIMR